MTTGTEARPARVRQTPSWLLTQTAARAHRLVNAALTAQGSHQHQYLLLAALDEFGPSSQASLARHCGLDRSDVVAIVGALTEQGLVTRAIDPANRRRNVITINPRGIARLQQLDHALARVQDELLAPLSATRRDQLSSLLTSILDHGPGEPSPAGGPPAAS